MLYIQFGFLTLDCYTIYFNVVRTEQLETKTETRESRLEILRPRPKLKDSRPETETLNLSLN